VITNCIVFEAAQCLEALARYGVIVKFTTVSYGTSLNLNDVVSDRSCHDKFVHSTRQSIRYDETIDLLETSHEISAVFSSILVFTSTLEMFGTSHTVIVL
jgi:hypothetical protein